MPVLCDVVFEIDTCICRYTKLADWEYINQCASSAKGLQLIGNGDIMSYTDYNEHMRACPDLATTMLARGALIKPWLFTEVLPPRNSISPLCRVSTRRSAVLHTFFKQQAAQCIQTTKQAVPRGHITRS